QVLARQIDRFVVLDGQVVVVDAPVGEAALSRQRRIALAQQLALRRLATFRSLLLHDPLQALGRGLDRALVDVAADPAAAELLRDGSGGTGADEAVEYQVIRITVHRDNARE